MGKQGQGKGRSQAQVTLGKAPASAVSYGGKNSGVRVIPECILELIKSREIGFNCRALISHWLGNAWGGNKGKTTRYFELSLLAGKAALLKTGTRNKTQNNTETRAWRSRKL